MRVIVNLYRWIILLSLLAIVAAVVLGAVAIGNAGGLQDPMLAAYGAAAFIGLVFVILTLGITATFISIHDRHGEIADELGLIREAIERHAGISN